MSHEVVVFATITAAIDGMEIDGAISPAQIEAHRARLVAHYGEPTEEALERYQHDYRRVLGEALSARVERLAERLRTWPAVVIAIGIAQARTDQVPQLLKVGGPRMVERVTSGELDVPEKES